MEPDATSLAAVALPPVGTLLSYVLFSILSLSLSLSLSSICHIHFFISDCLNLLGKQLSASWVDSLQVQPQLMALPAFVLSSLQPQVSCRAESLALSAHIRSSLWRTRLHTSTPYLTAHTAKVSNAIATDIVQSGPGEVLAAPVQVGNQVKSGSSVASHSPRLPHQRHANTSQQRLPENARHKLRALKKSLASSGNGIRLAHSRAPSGSAQAKPPMAVGSRQKK